MRNRNIISATILLLFGLFVLGEGVSLGVKIGLLMGPGFIPFSAGLLLSVLSIVLIVQSVVKGEDRGLKWFNVDGHLAKSKIKESEVPYERENNPTKLHKSVQGGRHQTCYGARI